MLMNSAVFVCAEDRQIRTDLRRHFGNGVAGRTGLNETNNR
jgi:hypothetical protein